SATWPICGSGCRSGLRCAACPTARPRSGSSPEPESTRATGRPASLPGHHRLGELVEAGLLWRVRLAVLVVVAQARRTGPGAPGVGVGQVHLQPRVGVGVEGVLRLDVEIAGRGGAGVRAGAELAEAPGLGIEVDAGGAVAGQHAVEPADRVVP